MKAAIEVARQAQGPMGLLASSICVLEDRDLKKKLEIIAILAVLVSFCAPAFAAKPMVISSRTLAESDGPVVIDLGKVRLVKVQLKGLDTSRIRLRIRGKEMTLKSWLDQGRRKGVKLGRKKEILLTANASNFPNISANTLKEVGRLKDFESYAPSTDSISGTVYVCGLIIYSCWEVP